MLFISTMGATNPQFNFIDFCPAIFLEFFSSLGFIWIVIPAVWGTVFLPYHFWYVGFTT